MATLQGFRSFFTQKERNYLTFQSEMNEIKRAITSHHIYVSADMQTLYGMGLQLFEFFLFSSKPKEVSTMKGNYFIVLRIKYLSPN